MGSVQRQPLTLISWPTAWKSSAEDIKDLSCKVANARPRNLIIFWLGTLCLAQVKQIRQKIN